jgi:hypothetical protein
MFAYRSASTRRSFTSMPATAMPADCGISWPSNDHTSAPAGNVVPKSSASGVELSTTRGPASRIAAGKRIDHRSRGSTRWSSTDTYCMLS